jgi:hypothetical protein
MISARIPAPSEGLSVIQNSKLNISDFLHAEIAIVDGTGSIVHFDAKGQLR